MQSTTAKQKPRTRFLRRASFVGSFGDFDVWTAGHAAGSPELRVIHVPTGKIRSMPFFHARIMAFRRRGRSEFWRNALRVVDESKARHRRIKGKKSREWLAEEGAKWILAERAKRGEAPDGMVFVKAHLRRKPGA
jgi:hypothetical protein